MTLLLDSSFKFKYNIGVTQRKNFKAVLHQQSTCYYTYKAPTLSLFQTLVGIWTCSESILAGPQIQSLSLP